ncbi:TOG array regulator of axonemal microtubules protein 2-like [Zonotrichia albicollis]|uniref:TOG array regulator of axonemal microtubules protein 2-like n=1 Tax=Zonotrichia albicollis TaxID=44394 RepID=UPI003D80E1E2
MAGAVPGAAAPMADPLLTVTPQMATGAKRREEPLRGCGQKDGAFSDPQQSLQEALSMLDSDDWELKKKALFNIPHLAESHPGVLLGRLREICLAATSEVTNLRSKVSCSAIVTLGELFAILKKDMDSEADEVAAVLLPMVWNSPEFIQKAACQSLGMMVENVTPARAITVLMDRGVKSRYVQVRKCAAELLLSLMEKMGVTKLAGTPRAERLPHVAGTLAQDCHKDTRHYGQEMVKMLLNNQKFKKLLEQSLSPHDLEDILTRIKKKEMENQKGECPSVEEPVKKRNDSPKKPQTPLPSIKRVKSAPGGRLLHRPKAQVTLPATVEGRESLQKLYHLLEAKGFQTRMEGVALLLDLCKSSPQLISTNIVQVFDYFVLRINDTHKKVKQQALEVLAEMIGLLEDALTPVMTRLMEGITKNLNSKDPGVHAAAVKALDKSIAYLGKAEPWHGLSSPVSLSIPHKRALSALKSEQKYISLVDEVSLMKELSHQWSQLGGEALLDVMERITVLVEWVYARSPEVVQRYALPVLWSCLENKALPVRSANICAVVTKLACALCEVMGTQLIKCAESKPPHVQENLSSLLGW